MRMVFSVIGRIAPGTAAKIGERFFTTPPRFPAPEREVSVLAEGSRRTILHEGRNLAYWSWGSGPLVLLVHGWGGRGGQLGAFVAPLVAGGFSVVTFDGPAHGESEGVRSSLPDFAKAVRHICDTLPQRPVAIVGHSMGAAASVLAHRDGLPVQALVLVAPPARPFEYLLRFGEMLWIPQRVIDTLHARIEERFNIRWDELDLARIASTMTVPMLLIHDRDDQDAEWARGREIADAWPGSELITTTGLGHRRILRDESVVRHVAAWLVRRLPSKPPL